MSRPSQVPAIICAENVALTCLLHEVPHPPSQNKVHESLIKKQGYILPLQKECDLVETLAFLSKTTDGPEHIPAVCVLQDPSGTCLSVILAINKAAHNSGNDILLKLQEEFKKLFSLLEEAQYGRNNETEHAILERIIEMCSNRIRCRLGFSKKSGGTSRKIITQALEVASQSLALIKPEKLDPNMVASCSSFSQNTNKLSKLVKAWLNYPKDHRLGEIVQEIYQVSQVSNIVRLLDLIPNRDMDPSLKKSLVNMIEKVSRYREAARALYRMAKKYRLVRHMRIETVNLPAEAFTRVLTPQYSPDLDETASRLGISQSEKAAIYPLLRRRLKPEQSNLANSFKHLVQDSLENAKVHAEVQIIAWCAIQAPILHPRIISSSKDACYLCNRFINLYGTMHMPKTHGRLYPGWRLPNILQFKHLEKEFNAILAKQIQESTNTILKNQRAIIHPQPNESTLLPLPRSATTLSITQVDGGNGTTDEYQAVTLTPQPIPWSMSDLRASTNEHPASLLSNCASSVSSTKTAISLKQGQPMSDHARKGKTSPIYVAGSLEISIELENVSFTGPVMAPLAWDVEWIKPEEIKTARNKDLVVDAQHLSGDRLCSLPESRCFCILSGDVMLKITCYTPMIDS